MSATFPGGVKNFGADHVNGDTLVPGDVNDLRAEVVALETHSVSQNILINGGFDYAQRQVPGTLTTIAQDAYSADRWRISRENADLQFQQSDGLAEAGLTSQFFGTYKKITNAGKLMVYQIVEGINSVPLRGKTVVFSIQMKASSSKVIRMAVIELQSAGTIDSIPATLVTAWNANSSDPSLGANLAFISSAQSKNVTTAMQTFTMSVTVPSTSKNLICAVWSDSQFAVNDTLSLAEAGLYYGPSTGWRARSAQQELALCARYAWVVNAGNVIAFGQAYSTTAAFVTLPLPSPMRAAPTGSLSAAGDFNLLKADASAQAVTSLAATTGGVGLNIVQLNFTVASGLVAGNGTGLQRANANAKIYLTAEL